MHLEYDCGASWHGLWSQGHVPFLLGLLPLTETDLHPKRNVTSGSDYLAIDIWLQAATARSFHVCSLHCWPCALSSAAEAEGKARGPNEGRCRDTQKRDGEINHMKEMNHSRQSSQQITPWHSWSGKGLAVGLCQLGLSQHDCGQHIHYRHAYMQTG